MEKNLKGDKVEDVDDKQERELTSLDKKENDTTTTKPAAETENMQSTTLPGTGPISFSIEFVQFSGNRPVSIVELLGGYSGKISIASFSGATLPHEDDSYPRNKKMKKVEEDPSEKTIKENESFLNQEDDDSDIDLLNLIRDMDIQQTEPDVQQLEKPSPDENESDSDNELLNIIKDTDVGHSI